MSGIDTQFGSGFSDFGLSPAILKALKSLSFDEPTPIQEQAIPIIMDGYDIMGLAQTGTGKTAAFGLPLAQHLMGIGSKPYPKTIRALILSPTRELANQIADNLKGFLRHTHLRVATVVGGQSINIQQQNLGRGNDILVATPGRLLDLVDRKAVILDSAKFLVLDEADQMLDLGFIHALKRISKLVAKERQTLLFSATMPKEIAQLARAYLNDPVRIEVAPPGKAADKITQSIYYVAQREKADLLKKLLAERDDDISLVFSRTKYGAEKLKKSLVAEGFPAGSIHGNKSQGQRDRAIKAFKSGEIRILVATDVAARGIDISGVSHVYNFDLPDVPANYVHRIGRTARAGAAGEAIGFCAPEEAHLLAAIEKNIGMKIEVVGGSMSDEERAEGARLAKEIKQSRGRRGKPNPRRGTKGPTKTSQRNPKNPSKKIHQVVEESAPQDDYQKVKAAGFTGKPNSKKNKKRFGNYKSGAETGSSVDADTPIATGSNRHSPQSRANDGNQGDNRRGGKNASGRRGKSGKKPSRALNLERGSDNSTKRTSKSGFKGKRAGGARKSAIGKKSAKHGG